VIRAGIDWSSVTIAGLLAPTIRYGTPIAYAALGETFSQRAGVINIGIEGVMLSGSCIGAVISLATGNVVLGFLAAIVGAMIVMTLIALLVLFLKADQIVVGVGLNLGALGITTIVAKRIGSDLTNVPALRPWKISGLKNLPWIGEVFFRSKATVYLLVPIVILCSLLLNHTSWGLRVKAVGETPAAADSAGVVVNRVRLHAMLACGALAGFGGAALSLGSASGFSENMVAGQGFIALVAVIFGRWRPGAVAAGALFFALFTAVGFNAAPWGLTIAPQIINSVPYVASLLALVFLRKNSNPPSALSRPFERQR
jgi:general nucleoside transport system permease protein